MAKFNRKGTRILSEAFGQPPVVYDAPAVNDSSMGNAVGSVRLSNEDQMKQLYVFRWKRGRIGRIAIGERPQSLRLVIDAQEPGELSHCRPVSCRLAWTLRRSLHRPIRPQHRHVGLCRCRANHQVMDAIQSLRVDLVSLIG